MKGLTPLLYVFECYISSKVSLKAALEELGNTLGSSIPDVSVTSGIG